MTLLLPTDGCPECLSMPVHPYDIGPAGDSFIALYHCPACGHGWWTGWMADAMDLPCPGCPECSDTKARSA